MDYSEDEVDSTEFQQLHELKRGQELILQKLTRIEASLDALLRSTNTNTNTKRQKTERQKTDSVERPETDSSQTPSRTLTRPFDPAAIKALCPKLDARDRFFFASMDQSTWLEFELERKSPVKGRVVVPFLGFQVKVGEVPTLHMTHRPCAGIIKVVKSLGFQRFFEIIRVSHLTVGDWTLVDQDTVRLKAAALLDLLHAQLEHHTAQIVVEFLVDELQATWNRFSTCWPLEQDGAVLWHSLLPDGKSLVRDLFDFVCSQLPFGARVIDKCTGSITTFSPMYIEFHSCYGKSECSGEKPSASRACWPLARVESVGLADSSTFDDVESFDDVAFQVEEVEVAGAVCGCLRVLRAGFLTAGQVTRVELMAQVKAAGAGVGVAVKSRRPLCLRCNKRHAGMCSGPFSLLTLAGVVLDCQPKTNLYRKNVAVLAEGGYWEWFIN
jgi:hypothetical protein